MKIFKRTSTILVIGIPILISSIYYHYETNKIKSTPMDKSTTSSNPSKVTKEIDLKPSFSFDDNVVSANIVSGVEFTKGFTINHVQEDIEQIAIIFTDIDSNNESKGRSANSSIIYTLEDLTGKIALNTKNDMWNIENSIGGSSLDHSINYEIDTYGNMLISTITEPIELELNKAIPLAVYIPSKSADSNGHLISIDNMSTEEIISSIDSNFSLIQIIALNDKEANPLDHK